MTIQILNIPITKGSKESCQTYQIKIGDTAVTIIGSRKGSRPIRHESCGMRVGVT